MEGSAGVQGAETESMEWTSMRRKRIRGRFRATLAGLLELEVLRVRHKEMVETALGRRPERPDHLVNSELQQRHTYWVEESSFRLKLKRSLSQENITDAGKDKTLANTNTVVASQSSEDLQQLFCPDQRTVPEHEDSCSRASSGFCDRDFGDAVGSLSTSLASLSFRNTATEEGFSGYEDTVQRWHTLLTNREEQGGKSSKEAQVFSKEVIPEAGFLSVVDLYPDSHWAHLSDILKPQLVLEPCYRSDLKSCLGSEVYRYPSPLHAIALQSPLHAPQSPIKHRKRNDRRSSDSATLNPVSLLRPNSVPKQIGSIHACCQPESTSIIESSMSLPWLQSCWTSKPAHSKNCRCLEIILKRAQVYHWSQGIAKNSDCIQSLSRRSMSSLQRTCSMGKGAASASFKFKHFQSRGAGACASDLVSSSVSSHTGNRERPGTHKNHLRRHTAALTNLNMFKESKGTSISCGVPCDRRCSVQLISR